MYTISFENDTFKGSWIISAMVWNISIIKNKPMKSIILVIIAFLTLISCNSQSSKSLFNGKDLDGWHVDVPEMDNNPKAINPFIVREGMLVSLGEPQGHLITDAVYQDFRLEVEYRFPGKPGNCGVLVFASTPRFVSCIQCFAMKSLSAKVSIIGGKV